ncbi:hypothetical protein KO498_14855 [Lentibacter algarum]|uniref:hypothetical protein n=1 Tax=Lentibacter algarum TaxID=576131 RepID=UPI001C0A54FD|nr:hypothetical protein [Lentibacter algarum]MBU2983089.1 hypothetical protein [Lentibacter algarum]
MTYSLVPHVNAALHDSASNSKQVFRPTWGARLLIPAVMLSILLIIDLSNMQISLTDGQTFVGKALLGITLFLALYQWIMLNFVCRIRLEGNTITSYGNSLFAQTRDLDGLSQVQTLHKEGLLKLTFHNAKPLYTMRYISQRDTFLALLNTHIARNT